MFASPIDARDEMFSHFDTSWTGLQLVADLDVVTRWQGIEEGDDIPAGYFVRVFTQAAKSNNVSFLQNGNGLTPQILESTGLIFVQVFAPRSLEDSYRNGELLAIAARNAFVATETVNGCWFRKASYVEMPVTGKHYMWKVSAEYVFDEAPRGNFGGEVGGGSIGGGW